MGFLTNYQWVIILILVLLLYYNQKKITESSGADSLVWDGIITTLPLKDLTIDANQVYY